MAGRSESQLNNQVVLWQWNFARGKEQTLNSVGEEILSALTTIAQAAQRALSVARTGISSTALANPSNAMVGEDKAEKQIYAMNSAQRENLRRLLREPFVARVEVDWGCGTDAVSANLLFCPTVGG